MQVTAWLMLVAALVCGFGCTHPDWIERTLVTVDVTGRWSGEIAQSGSMGHLMLTMELKQEGTRVTGSVQSIRGSDLIEGTVAGDLLEFRGSNWGLSAEMTVSGDEMTGRAYGQLMAGPIFLRRIDSSPPKP